MIGFVYLNGKAVVQMTTEMEIWLHQGRGRLNRWRQEPRLRAWGEAALWAGAGFLLSAASLGRQYQPLTMALVCCLTGWRAPAAALGGLVGYRVFWGVGGVQGMIWTILGCVAAMLLGKRRFSREAPLLMPMLAAFLVSATGLTFQLLWRNGLPFGQYLLRVTLAGVAVGLFSQVVQRRDTIFDWAGEALAVLALAQVAPIPWLGLGYVAAGIIAVAEGVPAGILAGLALDLAGVTRLPMTAVLALAALARLLPRQERRFRWIGAGLACALVIAVSGTMDFSPLAGLVLGGALGALLPARREKTTHRGATGSAQVRLELMAGVLTQTRQLLAEVPEPEIDEEAIICRTRERACGTCPNRRQCRDVVIPRELLHDPLTELSAVPIQCRKPGRLLLELRRGQEQLRFLKGDRHRREEYRAAVVQQYAFLGEYLRQTADALPRHAETAPARFTPEVAVCAAGRESANGDRCAWFAGTEQRYFILLCDGMGTGIGAAEEARIASAMLRQMLSAGFPTEYALRSVNSLTALRGLAGAVTLDLAEVKLTTGMVTLYKWGAPPSWVLRREGAEKIGTAGPPPGISVAQIRETVERLSLGRGEALILSSDGLDAGRALGTGEVSAQVPPGELAAYLLERGSGGSGDDATCAVVRLTSPAL